jgi:hypothetical protein
MEKSCFVSHDQRCQNLTAGESLRLGIYKNAAKGNVHYLITC